MRYFMLWSVCLIGTLLISCGGSSGGTTGTLPSASGLSISTQGNTICNNADTTITYTFTHNTAMTSYELRLVQSNQETSGTIRNATANSTSASGTLQIGPTVSTAGVARAINVVPNGGDVRLKVIPRNGNLSGNAILSNPLTLVNCGNALNTQGPGEGTLNAGQSQLYSWDGSSATLSASEGLLFELSNLASPNAATLTLLDNTNQQVGYSDATHYFKPNASTSTATASARALRQGSEVYLGWRTCSEGPCIMVATSQDYSVQVTAAQNTSYTLTVSKVAYQDPYETGQRCADVTNTATARAIIITQPQPVPNYGTAFWGALEVSNDIDCYTTDSTAINALGVSTDPNRNTGVQPQVEVYSASAGSYQLISCTVSVGNGTEPRNPCVLSSGESASFTPQPVTVAVKARNGIAGPAQNAAYGLTFFQ